MHPQHPPPQGSAGLFWQLRLTLITALVVLATNWVLMRVVQDTD